MAEDLTVALAIKAILDAKGFEDAKANLGKLASQTNKAAPVTDKLAKSTKQLGQDMTFTGARVSTLSQEILRNIGAGTKATAVGTGLSSAFAGIGNSAKFMGVAIGGATIALAFLLPLFVNWWTESKRVKEEQEKLRDAMLGVLEQIRGYVRDVPGASDALRQWADSLQALALEKQSEKIAELTTSISENEKKVRELTETKRAGVTIDRQGNLMQAAQVKATKEQLAEAAQLSKEIAREKLERQALLEAQETELTLNQSMTEGRRKAAEARRAELEAIRQEIEALDHWIAAQNTAGEEALAYANLQMDLREQQAKDAAADMKATGKAQEKQRKDELKKDTEHTLALIKNRRDMAEADKQAAALKRQMHTVIAQQASLMLGAMFGESKTARIAQAIIDTYAAANLAIATIPPPAGYAVAATSIAMGLANVANIRKQEVGFDDPFADLVARKLGQKSAVDFVRNFGVGFQGGMQGVGRQTSNVYNTTVNRGSTFSGPINVSGGQSAGAVRSGRRQFLLQLERELAPIRRLDARSKIGRR